MDAASDEPKSLQVQFNASVIKQARMVAPAFEFSLFAQVAVREKIQRDTILRSLFVEQVQRRPS